MAKFSSVNIDSATNGGCARAFALQQVLVVAGWVVRGSSDGTTYKATVGSQITHEGSGAGGMNNNRAWYWIEDPGGRRGFCVQRGTSQQQYRITYSALDRFIGGSPSATVVPTAADSQTIIGAGTDAAPTFSNLNGTQGRYYSHVVAHSAPEGDVYPFWCFDTEKGNGSVGSPFFLEPMSVGSYPSADADPCVVFAHFSAVAAASTVQGWYKMNLGGETFVTYAPFAFTNGSQIIGGGTCLPRSVYDDADSEMMIAVPFARSASGAQPGWKGTARYLRWKGVNRNYPDTIRLSSDAYVYVGQMCFPWEDGTLPAL